LSDAFPIRCNIVTSGCAFRTTQRFRR